MAQTLADLGLLGAVIALALLAAWLAAAARATGLAAAARRPRPRVDRRAGRARGARPVRRGLRRCTRRSTGRGSCPARPSRRWWPPGSWPAGARCPRSALRPRRPPAARDRGGPAAGARDRRRRPCSSPPCCARGRCGSPSARRARPSARRSCSRRATPRGPREAGGACARDRPLLARPAVRPGRGARRPELARAAYRTLEQRRARAPARSRTRGCGWPSFELDASTSPNGRWPRWRARPAWIRSRRGSRRWCSARSARRPRRGGPAAVTARPVSCRRTPPARASPRRRSRARAPRGAPSAAGRGPRSPRPRAAAARTPAATASQE